MCLNIVKIPVVKFKNIEKSHIVRQAGFELVDC